MSFEIEHFFSAENLSAAELNTILSIDLEYFPTPWSKASWSNLFLESNRLLTVVRNGEIIASFALFDYNVVDSFAHLLKIITIPGFRKQGVGELVLQSTISVLSHDKNITQFFLEVETGNLGAIHLYKKCGFQIIHTKKDFYGTGKDAHVMIRKS